MMQGKTVLVTGGSRGIGKETAKIFAGKGMNVVICSRTQKEIDSAVDELSKINSNVLGTRCDVSRSLEVQHLVSQANKKFGRIDTLINNAGIVVVKKMIDTSEKEWDETIDSNLKSAFLCSKAVLPSMIENNRGTIINVSSGAGKSGFENISAYCASKFGMIGLAESLAWEVAGMAIRIMTICPGEVATRMQEVAAKGQQYRLNFDSMLKPQEVAAKIADMAFDPKYVNGQAVDI